MFNDIKELNNEAKSFLFDSNKTLDNGEIYIQDGNDNKVTDEILESIEVIEKQTNNIYSEIDSINGDIDSFEAAINESKQIRLKELETLEDPGEGDLDIRDII